jgi:hypothetical protein
MFDFDLSLLSDPDFKEDSVREEIVVPILRRLGYSASGENKIVRSKSLLHPFVMIGSKKHPIHIIPDYLLSVSGHPALVLDAKSPGCDLIKSIHAEQAYSYAIHPEVRVRFYALCNGRSLVAYDINAIGPIFDIAIADLDRDWDLVESVLGPKNTSIFARTEFAPDFGIALLKMGTRVDAKWHFPFIRFWQVGKVNEEVYTLSSSVDVAGVPHMGSFDCGTEIFHELMASLDESVREDAMRRLQIGHQVYLQRPIYAFISAILGPLTKGVYEEFVPLLIYKVRTMSEAEFIETVREAFGDDVEV